MPKSYLSPEVEASIRKRLYSMEEAAYALGIERSSLYKLVKAGEIATVKVGKGRTLIADEELSRYVASLQASA